MTDHERPNGPVTTSELARWMDRHTRASDQAHRDIALLIDRLDSRIDKADDRQDALATRVTVIFAVVAVLWSIFLVIAPALRTLLGLDSG